MGLKLDKWASRIGPLYHLSILDQRVLTILARSALDYGESAKGKPSIAFVSRKKIAMEIYGSEKVKNLDRSIANLSKAGLIERIDAPAAKGRTQRYYLAIDEAMTLHREYLKEHWGGEKDAGEIDEAVKRTSGPSWKRNR